MAFLLHNDYEKATTLEHSTFNTASIKLLNHPLFVFYDLSAEIQTNVTQRQFTFHNKCSCKPFRFFFSFNLNQICKHLLAFQLFILIKYFFLAKLRKVQNEMISLLPQTTHHEGILL